MLSQVEGLLRTHVVSFLLNLCIQFLILPFDFKAFWSIYLQVQLSFMPEKIRAVVTSKEISPQEHNLQRNRKQTSNITCKDSLQNAQEQNNEAVANGIAAIEQLDEDTLREVTSETDVKMFKDAWRKAIEANEEVREEVINGAPYRAVFLDKSCDPGTSNVHETNSF